MSTKGITGNSAFRTAPAEVPSEEAPRPPAANAWPSTQGSLLHRLFIGGSDGNAWNEFVDLYAPLVYGYCRKRNLQDADASDVTQNVFLRLSSALRRFEYTREAGYFRGFLGTVTRNEIRRHRQKNQRKLHTTDVPAELYTSIDAEIWSEEFNDHVLRTAVSRIRSEFAPEVWWAFELLWIDERPTQEVAAIVDRERGWLYKAKHQVIKRLEEEILRLADDHPLLHT